MQPEVDREPTSTPLSLVTQNNANTIGQRQNLLDNTLRHSVIDVDHYNRVCIKIFQMFNLNNMNYPIFGF